MDNRVKMGKVCVEGRIDHKTEQSDYSIPLYAAIIIIVSMLATM